MLQSKSYRFGFLLEQTLGHRTHSQNLQANVLKDPSVQPVWGAIEWDLTGLAARLPIYNSNWTVRAGLRARRLAAQIQKQHPVDALFIHTQVAAVFMTDWMQHIPTIVSLDATPQQYDTLGAYYAHQAGPSWLEGLKWRFNYRCFQRSHSLVAWSQWTKDGLIDGYGMPEEKIVVIPPGVNSREWSRPTPRVDQGGPTKILFVGGDLQRKGGDLLLQAFRALREIHSETHPIELHLVTRDPVAAEPGVFVYRTMLPNSPSLKALFHACDIFCLPTYGDCLPMVLSEAGAAGMPLVSTNVGGIGEVVKNGENGFLVPTNNVVALAIALRTLIENPTLRLAQGEQAAELIGRDFDAERNTERLLTIMKQCVDGATINRKSMKAPLFRIGKEHASQTS